MIDFNAHLDDIQGCQVNEIRRAEVYSLVTSALNILSAAALRYNRPNTDEGLIWIDRLRGSLPHWHGKRGVTVSLPVRVRVGSAEINDLDRTVPALNHLLARHDSLEGYQSQYGFLVEKSLDVTTFQRTVNELSASTEAQDYLILAPVEASA